MLVRKTKKKDGDKVRLTYGGACCSDWRLCQMKVVAADALLCFTDLKVFPLNKYGRTWREA